MRKLFINSFGLLLLNIFVCSAAYSAQGQAIATIDIDRISKEAKVVKNIADQISKKRDKFQKEITKEEKKLEKEKKKLDAKKGVLSDSALQEEQKKFFKKVEKLKNNATKKDKILKNAYAKSIKKVNDMVGEIVDELAKEGSFSVVLPSSQVVYATNDLDITTKAIERLNKKVSKMKVKFN